MKINFNEMTEQTIPNFLGGNGDYNVKMYVDGEGNKMMVGRLAPGSSLGLHRHVINAEAIYVLSGEGVMHTDRRRRIPESRRMYVLPERSRTQF
ncbi:MAG: hypothetical protein L6V85_10370 [Clostridiales bacterium]|nr:MAG: hypothetical protein L6V85_10370 [Clostridiales bacterium]